MAKFYGKLGFAGQVEETAPSVYREVVRERDVCGDVLRQARSMSGGDKIHEDINITNQLSIVADGYTMERIVDMRYVLWLGVRWKISDIEVQPPRLILTLGGVYNGQTP